MRVYVAGPYGSPSQAEVNANIAAAVEVGKQLALRGHTPFIPHAMTAGWEKDPRFVREDFLRIDFDWLDQSEALYFIGPSPGANRERERAERRGLPIWTSMDEVPEA